LKSALEYPVIGKRCAIFKWRSDKTKKRKGHEIAIKKQKINPLDGAMRQVDIAAEKLKLDPGVFEKIKQTKRELIVHFPVIMGDGSVRIFPVIGFRWGVMGVRRE